MVNDSSLKGDAVQFAFDLDSQTGVTHLLASVRVSEISPEQKNELRDLIFLYTNGGKDQSVRNTLEQKIQAYKLVPVAPPAKPPVVEEAVPVQPAYPFGTSRPSPSFPVTAKVTDKEEQQPEAPVTEPKPEPRPVVPPVAPQAVVTSSPAPIPKPVEEKTPATPAPIPEPVPTPTPTPVANVPVPPPNTTYDSSKSLQRIREIKSLVNDKVGNPVNLVDINNEVGREYMGALLDAMKKLNNGTSALSAMKRLEEAYLVVEKTLAEHEEKQAEAKITLPEPAPDVTPTPPVKTEEAPKEVQTPIKPMESKAVPPPIKPVESKAVPPPTPPQPEPTTPIEEPKPPVPAKEKAKPVALSTQPKPPEVPPVSTLKPVTTDKEAQPVSLPTHKATVPVPKPQPIEPIKTELPQQPVQPVVAEQTATPEDSKEVPSAWGSDTDTVDISQTERTSLPADNKAVSLAQSKTKPRTPDELPLASALETSSVSGDPLFTKEVDDGLQQLLSEWILFKKSGLFGTGPKGREHPLFLKVAGLQIPLLLAGRFEGATQEIKQSITDYMNGWRYEQGIIYEQGETFEHYLRRVIRHILDLQKRKVVR